MDTEDLFSVTPTEQAYSSTPSGNNTTDGPHDGDVGPYKEVHGRSFAEKIWRHNKTGHYVALDITRGNFYGLLTVDEDDVTGDWDYLDIFFDVVVRTLHDDLDAAVIATHRILRDNPECIHIHEPDLPWQEKIGMDAGGHIAINRFPSGETNG